MRAARAKLDSQLERFIQRHGRDKVLKQPPGRLGPNDVVYVDNRSCGWGQIREVIGGDNIRNTPRRSRCISLGD